MTGLGLALIEGSALLTAVCIAALLSLPPLGLDLVTVMAQATILSLCCIGAFYAADLYDLRVVRSFPMFARRLVRALVVAFVAVSAFYLLFPGMRMADGALFSSGLVVGALVVPLRAVSYAVLRGAVRRERVLMVGMSPLGVKVMEEIRYSARQDYAIVGIVDDGRLSERVHAGFPIVGGIDELSLLVDQVTPDRIVVALSERRGRLPVDALLKAKAEGVDVEDAAHLYERLTGTVALESIVPSGFIFSTIFQKSRLELMVGNFISMAVAVFGLVGLAPLFALIALAIKLDSPGPVFFVHWRVGAHGRPFKLIKFRTMNVAEPARSEWARDNQDRITRVGSILRRYRFDELPQFINILRGDMNLVGPRPHPLTNYKLFSERIPFYAVRCAVRPGVTGWAQIRYGYANDLEEETEKMRYDLYYIKHSSVWFDLRILMESIRIIVFARGFEAADLYTRDAA